MAGKRGRPPLPEAKRRRNMVGMRLCLADRQALAECAKVNGRSLSTEAEYRVVRSLRDDDVMVELRAIRARLDAIDGGGR